MGGSEYFTHLKVHAVPRHSNRPRITNYEEYCRHGRCEESRRADTLVSPWRAQTEGTIVESDRWNEISLALIRKPP